MVQCILIGDGDTLIYAARPLGEAQSGDITFVESDKQVSQLGDCKASAVVIPPFPLPSAPEEKEKQVNGRALIQLKDPLGAFIAIARHLHGRPELPVSGVDPLAVVHPTARFGPDCSVHPFVIIGEGTVLGARCRLHPGCVVGRSCQLGDDVTLYPNVVLYDGTILGNRVVVHANAVLGSDGFGYRLQNGRHVKVPQLGHVEIADDVEIGACTTIDRGTFQPTRIGEGTKIDNLVQIGHNCRIGRHNVFAGQVGIAGSCTTGEYVVMAGQVGIADHIQIGDRAVMGAQSGVPQDVGAGERMFGTPARPLGEMKRIVFLLDRLPEMRRDLQRLKQHLGLNSEERGPRLKEDRELRIEDGESRKQAG
jgi:UDP-3-O-[3-hydroxymyristoyl] glucosamine N-acyltransferase